MHPVDVACVCKTKSHGHSGYVFASAFCSLVSWSFDGMYTCAIRRPREPKTVVTIVALFNFDFLRFVFKTCPSFEAIAIAACCRYTE